MSDQALADLARRAGLQIEWEDIDGRAQVVGPETLRLALQALGYPAGSEAQIAESRAEVDREDAAAPPLVTGEAGRPIALPPGFASGAARLELEGGGAFDVRIRAVGDALQADPVTRPGYHQLDLGERRITLAVAPAQAWTVADAAPGRRIWGVGLQLYGLHEPGSPEFGDFAALARFAAEAARAGADALAISPVHALFAADPGRFSPYGPSSRLFLNGLFADPALIDGGSGSHAPYTNDTDLIDWRAAWPAKLARLRAACDRFTEDGEGPLAADFQAFKAKGGVDLQRHAVFEALHARFLRESGAAGWREWPCAYRDAGGPAVAAFAREQARDVGFHLFLQWLARRSLAAAQDAARRGGMAVGLIGDLAVGEDPGGSHAWSRPDEVLRGLNVGAPPDLLGPSGQDWGLTTFSPRALKRSGFEGFIATLRAAMSDAGGVRIDHVMGLMRLWLVPQGAGATEGVYLAYPFTDLLRLVTLESWRARAIVVGEDLGTVPAGFRETLSARGVSGMQVLWFQRQGEAFIAPDRWTPSATALTSTHDLPTLAGWWRGRDLDWSLRLGRKSAYASRDEAEAARSADRRRLWSACRQAGSAVGEPPPPDQPAAAVDAAIGFVAATPCALALVQAEDLFGSPEQPNLPGTTVEHPNWRRRLPADAQTLFGEPAVAGRIQALARERPRR